jgi:hypothetical protein
MHGPAFTPSPVSPVHSLLAALVSLGRHGGDLAAGGIPHQGYPAPVAGGHAPAEPGFVPPARDIGGIHGFGPEGVVHGGGGSPLFGFQPVPNPGELVHQAVPPVSFPGVPFPGSNMAAHRISVLLPEILAGLIHHAISHASAPAPRHPVAPGLTHLV